MAATPTATALTEAHRLAQAQLGRRVVLDMLTLWPLLDPDDLDATFPRWLGAVRTLVDSQRPRSAALAGDYLTRFKTAETGGRVAPAALRALSGEALSTSMLVTGPASVRSNSARATVTRAVETARTSSARAAMRHVLDGGRQVITDTIRQDGDVLGWARATSGSACAFCAMLASRGPVYSRTSIDFKTHDGCGCAAEPVYRRDAEWPTGAARYQATWDQAKSYARDEGIRPDVAFRRLMEGRT